MSVHSLKLTRLLARWSGSFDRTAQGPESRWPPILAVLLILLLQLTLDEQFTVGPNWLVPALELFLLVPFSRAAVKKGQPEALPVRMFNIVLIAIVMIFNVLSLVLLIDVLIGGKTADGPRLLENALKLWIINVIAFGLWYWELDRGDRQSA